MGAENSRIRCLDWPRRVSWIGKIGRGAHCAELGGKVGVLDILKSCPSIRLQNQTPCRLFGICLEHCIEVFTSKINFSSSRRIGLKIQS
jgi:hypothetical protein